MLRSIFRFSLLIFAVPAALFIVLGMLAFLALLVLLSPLWLPTAGRFLGEFIYVVYYCKGLVKGELPRLPSKRYPFVRV